MIITVSKSTLNCLSGWQRAYQRVYGKLLPYSNIIDFAFDIFLRRDVLTSISVLPSFVDEPKSNIRCVYSHFHEFDLIREMYLERFDARLDDNDILFLVLQSLQFYDTKVYSYYLTEERVLKNTAEIGQELDSDLANEIVCESIDESYALKQQVKKSVRPHKANLLNDFFNGDAMGIIPESLLFCLLRFSVYVCRVILFVCKLARVDEKCNSGEDTLRPEQVSIPYRLLVSSNNHVQLFCAISKMIDVSINLKEPYYGSFVLFRKVEKTRGGVTITLDPSFWDVYYSPVPRRYSFDWNIIHPLSKKTAIFFYILVSNSKYALTFSRNKLMELLCDSSEKWGFFDVMRSKIKPAKAELDEKSPVTFYYTYRRSAGGVFKIYSYHRPRFYVKEVTLQDIIGAQAYSLLVSFGLKEGDIKKHENDIKLVWETGELVHILESIKSFLSITKKTYLIWEVIDDYLKENGLK